MREAGAVVRIHRPYAGEPLPTIAGADALVVLGGSMSANDDDRVGWLGATKGLLRQAVSGGCPRSAFASAISCWRWRAEAGSGGTRRASRWGCFRWPHLRR